MFIGNIDTQYITVKGSWTVPMQIGHVCTIVDWQNFHQSSRAKGLVMDLKISTQWDLVGISAALLTFVSFYVFMYCGPLQGGNLLLSGFGNPLLMVFYLLFSFISFICGYLESEKDKPCTREEREIVFINISQWWRAFRHACPDFKQAILRLCLTWDSILFYFKGIEVFHCVAS